MTMGIRALCIISTKNQPKIPSCLTYQTKSDWVASLAISQAGKLVVSNGCKKKLTSANKFDQCSSLGLFVISSQCLKLHKSCCVSQIVIWRHKTSIPITIKFVRIATSQSYGLNGIYKKDHFTVYPL